VKTGLNKHAYTISPAAKHTLKQLLVFTWNVETRVKMRHSPVPILSQKFQNIFPQPDGPVE